MPKIQKKPIVFSRQVSKFRKDMSTSTFRAPSNLSQILNTENNRESKLSKMDFDKRRQTFDQTFINEEDDQPFDNRRQSEIYYAGTN